MTRLDEFVTIKQAAKFLGVSANTLRNWHRDARIPVYRNPISDYRLFKKTDLEELLRHLLSKDEAGRSTLIHEALVDYTKIIETIDIVADDALARGEDVTEGLGAVAEAEKEFLVLLEGIA